MLQVFQISSREFKRIFKKTSYLLMLTVLPVVLFTLFASIYSKQSISNLPIGIVDKDQTDLSRKLFILLKSNHLIKTYRFYNSVEELKVAMTEKDILGGVYIGKGFEKNIKQFQNFDIHMYRSSTSMVYGKILYKSLAQSIMTLNAGISLKRFETLGLSNDQAMNLANPIRIHSKAMYNPSYNYQNYLLPGLTTVSIQMILIMICVLSFNTEIEENTFLQLTKLSKNKAIPIIMGKMITYYTFGMFHFFILFQFIFPLFDIPYTGDFFQNFTLFSLFVLACISVGFMVSSILSESLMASDIAVFYTAPSFVFSGFTFPGWAMPWYDQIYSTLMPYTSFLEGMIRINSMQVEWSSLTGIVYQQILFIGIGLSVSFAFLKLKIKKSKQIIGA